ncbi:MAG: hypothetical protein STSR0004_19030 [Peptococcaceae bacterium]
MSQLKQNQVTDAEIEDFTWKSLYKVAGVAALVALCANVLDIVLGFGETEVIVYSTMTATEWFALYHESWFKGLYTLGFLNIIYMACMVPVLFALFAAHRHKNGVYAALAMIVYFIGMAIYISNSAAIPMFVLSSKYAAATTDAQRALLAAAGEAVLACGEDFTPGSFIGLMLGGIAAIMVSFVMLRGRIFGKATAWTGIIGFTLLSVFTILSTFVPVLLYITFYVFGMIGGLFALAWFVLVARRFFQLGRGVPKKEASRIGGVS